MVPDYKSIAKHCNLWRNWDDIQDSWTSVLSIIDWFAEHQDEFQQFAGPGNWNDPDMVSNIDATVTLADKLKFRKNFNREVKPRCNKCIHILSK